MPRLSYLGFSVILAASGLLFCATPATAVAPKIAATPHDEHHLLVVRSSELTNAQGAPAPTVEDLRGSFDRKSTPVVGPLSAPVKVCKPGKYILWVRVVQPAGRQTPLAVAVKNGPKKLLEGTINNDAGAPGRGGAKAYAAYAAAAKVNTPKGAVASLESTRFEVSPDSEDGGKKAGGAKKPAVSDDLGDDLLEELRDKPADPWTHLARLDELVDKQSSYWWKAGEVELAPGRVEFNIAPAGALPKKPADAPRFDAAFLTTNDQLTYPYAGDIDETRATFIRFRLDKLPKEGVRLGADFQTHVLQQPRLSTRFGREIIGRDDLHTATGYTPWYRLQDVKYMPAASSHEIGVRVSVNHPSSIYAPTKGYAGATQFASFPHPDYIVREFDWSEPTGLNYACPTDVENYAHRLMTFRDQAREHYQTALAAAQRVSPLTRGELYFTTIAGSLGPDDRDYLLKTMRLLGINSLCEGGADAAQGRKLYGWSNAYFAATMPLGDLFDAEKARKTYDDYFRPIFQVDPEAWKDTWSFCYMDEPGELYREAMTGPFWQYIDGDEPYWFDPVGDSALHIRHEDLPDCVLEGVFERTGTIEFRAGLDDLAQPKKYHLWAIGYPLGPAINSNLAYGKYVEGATAPSVGYRMVTALGVAQGKLKFKIVYQKGVATLFINDRTIHQLVDLPKNPSFGIAGGVKKIYALRLRPLQPGEGVKLEGESAEEEAESLGDAVLEELDLADPPEWARPTPLEDFVDVHCVKAGGVAGVAEAFRAWLAEQGLKPDFFGAKSWDDVRPLTLPSLVASEDDARLYYWSRRFSSQLTPRNFGLISESIHGLAPNKKMVSYAALSGGVIYRARQMPLDMFQVGSLGDTATGGISDWMFYSSWRWDSHQVVAYSAELYNAGARRHGAAPVSFPMMHCVSPSTFRAFTQLGAQVKLMSLYSYGPYYLDYPDSWARGADCYDAIARLTAKSAPADDILAPGVRRPSRVALLYPHSSEYWSTDDSFDDRRATFLALSHDYYQPEVVTEQQVIDGALAHYDALYVVDRHVATAAQESIRGWVAGGGRLWACADALTRDEYDQPADLLQSLVGLERTWTKDAYPELTLPGAPIPLGPRVAPAGKEVVFRPHQVAARGLPSELKLPKDATVLAKYDDGRAAWCEAKAKSGQVTYVGHRAGATYVGKNILLDGHRELWADTGREVLTGMLARHKVQRELILSDKAIMASPITSPAGTAIVLYNMRPSPRKDLKIQLREPAKPHSVTRLVDGRLAELAHEYADGVVTIELPSLVEDDMVYVRSQPPADDRLAVIRERTEQQLQASDAESLSAGAWIAGFYPDWKLAEQVARLVTHDDWRVRRAAAESLARLRYADADEALAQASAKETDPHVLAEQLAALVSLGDSQAANVASERAKDPRFVVRTAALGALANLLATSEDSTSKTKSPSEVRTLAQAAALVAIGDADQRVRTPAMEILCRIEPELAVVYALAAFAGDDPPAKLDRPVWAKALAANDSAWKLLLAKSPQLALGTAIELGQQRADSQVARALVDQAGQATPELAHAWSLAMIRQRDAAGCKQLLAGREQLPPRVVYYLPIILEYTFETGLGNVLADWDAELKQ